MRKQKRAQIGVFLIVGLVILMVFGLVSYLSYKSRTAIKGVGISVDDSAQINNFVSTCLKDAVNNNLHKYGAKENVLENAVTLSIKDCVNDFKVFKKQGYKVTQLNPKVDVEITNTSLVTSLSYPLEFEKKDIVYKEDSFNYLIDRISGTEIRTDNEGRTLNTVTVTSDDGKAELIILKGTNVNNHNVYVKIKDNTYDKEKYGLMSSLVYEFQPTGITFDPKAILRIMYEAP